jgi:hypothetical protein
MAYEISLGIFWLIVVYHPITFSCYVGHPSASLVQLIRCVWVLSIELSCFNHFDPIAAKSSACHMGMILWYGIMVCGFKPLRKSPFDRIYMDLSIVIHHLPGTVLATSHLSCNHSEALHTIAKLDFTSRSQVGYRCFLLHHMGMSRMCIP